MSGRQAAWSPLCWWRCSKPFPNRLTVFRTPLVYKLIAIECIQLLNWDQYCSNQVSDIGKCIMYDWVVIKWSFTWLKCCILCLTTWTEESCHEKSSFLAPPVDPAICKGKHRAAYFLWTVLNCIISSRWPLSLATCSREMEVTDPFILWFVSPWFHDLLGFLRVIRGESPSTLLASCRL